MNTLVALTQANFIPGRQGSNNIVVAQELLNSMKRKRTERWYGIKNGLRKINDCINRACLQKIISTVDALIKIVIFLCLSCFLISTVEWRYAR